MAQQTVETPGPSRERHLFELVLHDDATRIPLCLTTSSVNVICNFQFVVAPETAFVRI
jgi:hypothetical protein